MFNIGPLELMVILVVALLVVGPKRLPEVGRSIGKGLRELRKAQDEVQRTLKLTLDESLPSPTTPAPAPPAPVASTEGAPPADADAETGSAKSPSATPGATEVAATLGQGIAELRRVREELQRTFRVDLEDETPTKPTKPPVGPTRRDPVQEGADDPSAPTGETE